MSQAALTSNEALRARRERPNRSRGCTLSPRTRGDTTELHGPLQRLLDGTMRMRQSHLIPPPPLAPIRPVPPPRDARDTDPEPVTQSQRRDRAEQTAA